MKLEYAQLRPGCADGACRITAKGGILASLHWADQNGPLENWTQLALLPLRPPVPAPIPLPEIELYRPMPPTCWPG